MFVRHRGEPVSEPALLAEGRAEQSKYLLSACRVSGALAMLAITANLGLAQLRPDGSWALPAANNVWFAPPDWSSDTVFVFVHGYNSDSAQCWVYGENGESKQYWPYLVWYDSRLRHPAVFLGGYTLGQRATFRDMATEQLVELQKHDVMRYRNIVFVAHSMGGVIVRRMLTTYARQFAGKKVGVVLFASPSTGSFWAQYDSVVPLLGFPNPRVVKNLQVDSMYLTDLDQDFKELLDSRQLNIMGAEAVEGNETVVDRDSGSRYFYYEVIPGTGHFSIVKPPTIHSEAHEFLVRFYQKFQADSPAPENVATAAPPVLSQPPVQAPTEQRTYAEPAVPSQPPVQPWPKARGWSQTPAPVTPAVPRPNPTYRLTRPNAEQAIDRACGLRPAPGAPQYMLSAWSWCRYNFMRNLYFPRGSQWSTSSQRPPAVN
jgi:pimeloyl-ACP methyl ester carboxylesterase